MYEWIATNCPGMEKGLLLTFSTATTSRLEVSCKSTACHRWQAI